jgi:hypothetical protein
MEPKFNSLTNIYIQMDPKAYWFEQSKKTRRMAEPRYCYLRTVLVSTQGGTQNA